MKIERIENTPGLDKIIWRSIPIWDVIRHSYILDQRRLDKPGDKRIESRASLVWRLLAEIYSFLGLMTEGKTKYLFWGVESNRLVVEKNGRVTDKWVDPIVGVIGDEQCVKITILPLEEKSAYSGRSRSIGGLVGVYTRLWRLFALKRTMQELNVKINELNDAIISAKCEPLCAEKVRNRVVWTFCRAEVIKFILRWLRPEIFFLVCSYGRESAVLACNKAGVPCVEIQHGIISKNHPGYSFPYLYKKKLFPDYIFAYGMAWFDEVILPISKDKIIEIGDPFRLKNEKSSRRKINQIKRIVICSQWIKTDIFCEFSKDLSSLAGSDYLIIFRPHPAETITEECIEQFASRNIVIEDPRKVSAQQSLSGADFVVGGNSTLLYEAHEQGLPVIVLEKAAIDDSSIMGFEFANVVDTAESCLSLLKSGALRRGRGRGRLFGNFSREKLLSACSKVSADSYCL